MGAVQFAIGALQIADRTAHHHHARMPAPANFSRRPADRNRREVPVGGQQVPIALLDGLRGGQTTCHLTAFGWHEQVNQRLAQQGFLGLAHNRAQRRVDLSNPPARIADNQHIGHGAQHRCHKGAGLFQLLVLLFQRHLAGHQIGIDLVHLVDHIDPHILGLAQHRGRHQAGRQARRRMAGHLTRPAHGAFGRQGQHVFQPIPFQLGAQTHA